MTTFTYSKDIDVMIAQSNITTTVVKGAKRDQSIAWLLAIASWKRANAKRFGSGKEFANESGISQSQVSKAIRVLEHYEILAKANRSWVVSDDNVADAIVTFVDSHAGKAPSGIYIDLFGTDDTWTLAAACETLVKAARKRDISDDEVLAIIRQTLEAGE